MPDSTTITKFRKLLNDHKLGEALFAKVGKELQARGFKVNTGTIVDATIIGAPSSTKNADNARDPEMHQTRKGRQPTCMTSMLCLTCCMAMNSTSMGTRPMPARSN